MAELYTGFARTDITPPLGVSISGYFHERLADGVLALPECHEKESFEDDLLEYPQYTRPPVWMGREVPEVLLSGHHAKIDKWRLEQSKKITAERRPDLAEKSKGSK